MLHRKHNDTDAMHAYSFSKASVRLNLYYMKIIFLTISMLCIAFAPKAQVILPSVVNSAGTSGIISNIHFEFNLGEVFSNTIENGNMVTQGLLQPLFSSQGPLPVSGLVFNAMRISNFSVELKWTTQQEINNAGFYVERRKEGEAEFTTIAMVASKGMNGNASLPLNYNYEDNNSYTGKTFYRLRQKDIDGKETFSDIKAVSGTKSTAASIKVWPVPAIDKVNVLIKGIDAPQTLLVLDIQGRLVKKYSVNNEQTVVVTGLVKGMYVLRLNTGLSSVAEKIVMQ
ncbi:MAG: T9SS type A sorting domain-containing protein [Crocinitomicaceae bacterium]|nr:MAG: T9SS type A sorting domain-containing protein [Crocinitomicaceae bacterium]